LEALTIKYPQATFLGTINFCANQAIGIEELALEVRLILKHELTQEDHISSFTFSSETLLAKN